jgi:hypothetical protein
MGTAAGLTGITARQPGVCMPVSALTSLICCKPLQQIDCDQRLIQAQMSFGEMQDDLIHAAELQSFLMQFDCFLKQTELIQCHSVTQEPPPVLLRGETLQLTQCRSCWLQWMPRCARACGQPSTQTWKTWQAAYCSLQGSIAHHCSLAQPCCSLGVVLVVQHIVAQHATKMLTLRILVHAETLDINKRASWLCR